MRSLTWRFMKYVYSRPVIARVHPLFPKAAEGKDPTLTQEVDIPKGQGETILLVEDRPEVLEIAKEMLEQLNYGVVTAENGKDALSIYESDPDNISAVLTDMVMPEMGGLELINELRKRNPEIKTVVMTGYPLGEVGMDELPLEISGTLKKPLNVEQVSRVLGQALNRHN